METDLQKLLEKHGADFVVNNLLQMARGPSKDRAFALLEQIAGQKHDSQKAWVDWWKENKRRFPERRTIGDPDESEFDKLVQEVVRATERRKKPRPAANADATIASMGSADPKGPAPQAAQPPGGTGSKTARRAKSQAPPAAAAPSKPSPVERSNPLPAGWTRENPTVAKRRKKHRFQLAVLLLFAAIAAIVLSDLWFKWLSR